MKKSNSLSFESFIVIEETIKEVTTKTITKKEKTIALKPFKNKKSIWEKLLVSLKFLFSNILIKGFKELIVAICNKKL